MNIDTKRLIRLLELKDNDILALEQRVLKLINEVKKVNKMKVQFKKCHEDAVIPKYAHSTDSGIMSSAPNIL